MTKRLAPYGSEDHAGDVAKVGKVKAPRSLAARMPSPDIVAKVGQKNPATQSLAARMPSADIVAKVGIKLPASQSLAARMPSPAIAAKIGIFGTPGARSHRVVRRNQS
jgi:hypothetical protein